MTYSPSLTDSGTGIWRLGFNRPEKRNSLDPEVAAAIRAVLAEAAMAEQCRVVILEGDARAFCAGADFDALTRTGDDLVGSFTETESALAALAHDLRTLPKPTIAALRGNCYGAGVQMAAACDMRIAADDLVFAVPAVNLHLIYPVDALADLIDMAGKSAVKRLIYSAERFSAADCLALGFVDQAVPVAGFEAALMTLAEKIAATPSVVTEAYKRTIDHLAAGGSLNAAIDIRDAVNRAGPMEERLGAIAAQRAGKK